MTGAAKPAPLRRIPPVVWADPLWLMRIKPPLTSAVVRNA